MSVTATFKADFADFDRACERATEELGEIQTEAAKVSVSIDAMAGKASKSASVLTGAFGSSTKSAEEFETSVVSAADVAQVSFQKLPSVFSELRNGLNDVAEGAGVTFENLGLVSSAGLAIGVGYEAWQIGRAIADFLNLDETISNATSSMMGWGNAAQEAAGAKADALARASKLVGREVTSMGEALEINGRQVTEWNDTMRRANAPEESRLQLARWRNEIGDLKDSGVLEQFTADLKSNDLSIQFLAKNYGVSTGAISLYKKELQDSANQQKSWNDYVKQSEEGLRRQNAELDKWTEKVHAVEAGGSHAFGAMRQWLGEMASDQKYLNELADQHAKKLIELAGANERFLKQALDDALAIDRQRDAWISAASAADQAAMSAERASAAAAKAASGFSGLSFPTVSTDYSSLGGPQVISANLIPRNQGALDFTKPKPGVPRASGGPVNAGSSYLVGEQGPELFVPATSGSIVPNGSSGGASVVNNFYVNGTAADVARQVMDHITKTMKQGRQFPAS